MWQILRHLLLSVEQMRPSAQRLVSSQASSTLALPGMVQLETFRQAALALTTPAGGANRHRFLGCDVRFLRMVHAHASVRCLARSLEAHTVHLELADDNLLPLTEGSVRLG